MVNNTADDFYKELNAMKLSEDDSKFDMIKPVESGTSVEDFMKQFETK